MAAVDRRLGMIRRGTTPAAPKPINLPSQKLENQGLVPDVELVPRGTCCWGGAGRASAASGKNNERTDSASSDSANSKTADNGTNVENDIGLLGLEDHANPSGATESTAPVPACIASAQTTTVSSSFEANDVSLDKSPARSDAGSLSGSSTSECGTSPSVSPVTINKRWDSAVKVEEQKHRKGSPTANEGSESVLNLETKQGACGGNGSLPGCQDFGYFEGVYSPNHTFFSPGMLYSNGQGMAFGGGSHAEQAQHDGFYSFLGVPYYDSTKNKEIVVITMVGNPGSYGNYLPQASLSDQYSRPTMFGNFPLQFGHFDNFAMPGHGTNPMSAEMNSMCLGEQGESVCYEQGYYKDNWLSGSSIRDVQSGNGAFWPSLFPMCKNIPKRAGRQKSTYRNRRAAPRETLPADLKPERRVTLLTKFSQHEVIISSLQKTSEPIENGLAGDSTGASSFGNNFPEAPIFDPQCESTIAESSSADEIHERDDMDKSHVSDVCRSLSAQEIIPQQMTCTGLKNEDSALLSGHDIPKLESKAEASISESSSPGILTSTSRALGDQIECHEDCPKKSDSSFEAECVSSTANGYNMTASALAQDSPIHNPFESTTVIERATEQVNRDGTLCTTTVVLLPHKHTEGFPDAKSDMKWRRKGAVAMANLGLGDLNSKARGAVVDIKASSLPSANDSTFASTNSLPEEPVITKAVSKCNDPLPACTPASCSASEGSAAAKADLDAAGPLQCAVLNSISNVDVDCVTESRSFQKLESSIKLPLKTQSLAKGYNLNWRIAPCGFGKEWRPKLAGAGHGKLATKASSHRAGKAFVTLKVSKPEEVSCDDVCKEKFKQQQQDEARATLSYEADRKEAAQMMRCTCATEKNFNNLVEREQNTECYSNETLPSNNSNSDNHLGSDEQASKPPRSSNLSSTTQMQTQTKFTKVGGGVHSSQKSNNQPMLATQLSQPMNLNRKVNISSKAALRLQQQEPSATKKQVQKQLPVEKAPQGHVGPGPIMENTQHSALVAKSMLSFERPFVKLSPYVASQGGRKLGVLVDSSKFKRFNQKYGHHQEAQRNLMKQAWQKVWCCKVMLAQEHRPTLRTCKCLTKPCEECCTFSGGKPGTENKQSNIIRQGALHVLWKPKQMPITQIMKDNMKEEGKENPLSSALQKERPEGECPITEYPGYTPLSLPSGNKQQLDKRAPLTCTLQMKDPSGMCPITSCDSAPPSPSCGSGQQVENVGNQGLTKPASPLGMALVKLNPAAVPFLPCGSGQQISDADTKAVFGPTSQPISAVATSFKLEDDPFFKGVKQPHQNHPFWRRKTPFIRHVAVKSASKKEGNENDLSMSLHVERAPKKRTNLLPAHISAASDSLHVWGRDGGRVARAYPHLQKLINYQGKIHTDGAVPLELLNKPSQSEVMTDLKHVKIPPPQVHTVSKLKCSQHHVYAVKEAQLTAHRRPFSMKSDFSYDDNKKVLHYQRPLTHTNSPMEQGHSSPFFFGKPKFDSKRVFHHQLTPKHAGQIKMSENSNAQGLNRAESLRQSGSSSDVKPVRHGHVHCGRKFGDSDKKGWVVKAKARCGDC